jgi:hypothetical protein
VFRRDDKEKRADEPGQEQIGAPLSSDQEDDFWGEAKKEKGLFRRFGREARPPGEEAPPPFLDKSEEKPEKPEEPKEPEELEVSASLPLEEVFAATDARKKDFSFEVELEKPAPKVEPPEVEPPPVKPESVQAAGEPPAAVVAEPAPEKEERPRREIPIALQMPDEYHGMLTESPSYLKAVLWGLLAGAVGAGVYAVLAWWLHREYGIIGWLIGVAVGLAMVFGSGRHFSWKLGLIAAGISMFFLCVGRILVYMLDVWFPDIINLPVETMDNFSHALTQFVKQLPTTWLVFLFITGAVAFLVSFRPWPIRLQTPGTSSAASPQSPRE